MGRHDAPNQPWIPIYTGYQCEGCEGVWATVQVDEGVIPDGVFCLATERCRGPVVCLIPTYEPPPDHVPIYAHWFKPKNVIRFRHHPYINDHLDRGGLLMIPTPIAPDWVKRKIGYYGGLRTY